MTLALFGWLILAIVFLAGTVGGALVIEAIGAARGMGYLAIGFLFGLAVGALGRMVVG